MHRWGHVWGCGACMARGVHGGEHAWWGACMLGGSCMAGEGGMYGGGVCGRRYAGRHVWQGAFMVGSLHVWGGLAWQGMGHV